MQHCACTVLQHPVTVMVSVYRAVPPRGEPSEPFPGFDIATFVAASVTPVVAVAAGASLPITVAFRAHSRVPAPGGVLVLDAPAAYAPACEAELIDTGAASPARWDPDELRCACVRGPGAGVRGACFSPSLSTRPIVLDAALDQGDVGSERWWSVGRIHLLHNALRRGSPLLGFRRRACVTLCAA